jgi:hypothetical protein
MLAEAAEAGVKSDLRPMTMSGLGGKRRKRRIAAAAIAREKENPPDRSGG